MAPIMTEQKCIASISAEKRARWIQSIRQHPQSFLIQNNNHKNNSQNNNNTSDPQTILASALSELFQLATETEPATVELCPELTELLVEGFDADQIWEQLQLRNEPVLNYCRESLEGDTLRWNEDLVESDRESQPEEMQADSDKDALSDSNEEQEEEVEELESMSEISMDDDEGEQDQLGEDIEDEDIEDEDIEDEDAEEDIEESANHDASSLPANKTNKSSSLDDDFFSLAELERFADQEPDEDGDDFDYSKDPDELDSEDMQEDLDKQDSGDEEEEEDAIGPLYRDFFDPPKTQRSLKERPQRRVHFDHVSEEESSDEEEGEDEEPATNTRRDLFDENNDTANPDKEPQTLMTTHEKRTLRLQESIRELEEENVREKEWTLMGEASVKNRPVNSLLEQDLDFEYASKPAPVITEETTVELDQLISKRIVDELWDDVERKLGPSELAQKMAPHARSQRLELNDEKSTQSLAQIYETEFQKQKETALAKPLLAGTEATLVDTRTPEQKKEHEEIQTLFRGLCYKLDALTNWHYTPKPATLEMEVVTAKETPALEMEEVTPAHVSDAQTLAPQEIFVPKKTTLEMKSQEEMTGEEKAKLRRLEKTRVRKEKQRREKDRKVIEKLNPGLGNKYSKGKALEELKKQKNVSIIGKSGELSRKMGNKQQEDANGRSAKKLKL